MLLQVLAAAGHLEAAIKAGTKVAGEVKLPPEPLTLVAPIFNALAAKRSLPRQSPSQIAVHTLWEAWAVDHWGA